MPGSTLHPPSQCPFPPLCTPLARRTDNCARTVRRREDFDRIATAFSEGEARLRGLSSFAGKAGRGRCGALGRG